MRLVDFYFHDPRVALIPIEHLRVEGMVPAMAAALQGMVGWDTPRIELFNRAFQLYWERSSGLAVLLSDWPAPRLRHVAVVREPLAVRPYAPLLNTSSWTMYEGDFDLATSSVELAAYLFVHGDRMVITGEVSQAALLNASYWRGRSTAEIDDFSRGASRSLRPDAATLQAIAEAAPWLRRVHHLELDRGTGQPHGRPLAGTRLHVPADLAAQPVVLIDACARAATQAVHTFQARWSKPDLTTLRALLDWLADDRPPVLITGSRDRVLWDPDHPDRVGSLRNELRPAGGAAIHAIHADLHTAAAKTRRFHGSLRYPERLPRPHPDTLQTGYTYLHRTRGRLAYNLHEPILERLQGPALPYALPMLAARTIHEWCHLAVDAGWVPAQVPDTTLANLHDAVANELDRVVSEAPPAYRDRAHRGLEPFLAGGPPGLTPGAALARLLMTRISDYQGNLLAGRFLDRVERETYVRHNIRTLAGQYPREQLWQMLVRYLTEFQYLRFSTIDDPREFLFRSTWFDRDFLHGGVLSEAAFDRLDAAIRNLFAAYAVDESQFTAASSG